MPRIALKKKPAKPHPDWPLYAHASGQWAKKIMGKVYYFGTWDDPQAALKKYNQQKDDLFAGQRPIDVGLTIKELCNLFTESKANAVDSGELTPRSLHDYTQTCETIIKMFGSGRRVEGLRPLDFEHLRAEIAKHCGPVRLGNEITRVRVVFNHGYQQSLIDRPVKFGKFKKPSRNVLRKHRASKGPRMFQAIEIRNIIATANPQLKAMIYLGINCGLGNNDCALLAVKNIKDGWLNYPRPKTGIDRRCPLWPETIDSLSFKRPEPKDPVYKDRIFITKYKTPWGGDSVLDRPITKEFAKLLGKHKAGLGFYALRHTFQTIGMKLDKDATKSIMGHAEDSNDMSAVYNEENVSDGRLQAVVDYVREWLLAVPANRSHFA
jgi:integrase